MKLPQCLPGPNADLWDWQLQARCRGADVRTFFSPDGERGHARLERETRAKLLCQACPVLAHCRAHALRVGEPYGTWGGLTEAERARLLGQLPGGHGPEHRSGLGLPDIARPADDGAVIGQRSHG
ncbi:WhiB family transcriptional regulator [Mycolicibacterium mucogenicum]|uniref:WhiB family transcriptional regulator n=1 Tax=Mycolicibacterium mucogenicum TaxID=56689 RepID=UPI0009F3D4D2|nr:WhiB family transcriptional regulator [Mycolicibacterium mucogenicum]